MISLATFPRASDPVPSGEGHPAHPESGTTSVCIVLFDDVEELDFVGPWEVFSIADRLSPGSFPTSLVTTGSTSITARYGLHVDRLETLDARVPPRLLILPGGPGRLNAMKDPKLLEYVRRAHSGGSVLASVCTGVFVLAEAGLLQGRSVTTHWSARDELTAYPGVTVVERRYVDAGDIVTAAGISAGIDVSLHLVERFAGTAIAWEVAHRMEYPFPLPPPPPGASRT